MPFKLSDQHLAAVDRRRRVVVNRDAIHGDPTFTDPSIQDLVGYKFDFIDHFPTHIDSLWWNWGEGHQAPYPSKILPHYAQTYNHPGYQKWLDEGIDPVQIFLDETRKRKLEAFYSYRINGGDNDLHLQPTRNISLKEAHPDWLIHLPWRESGLWNFAVQGVRDYKLSILREVAENYNFDGMEIDFARTCPVLPPGRQWQLRHHLTEFMRELRAMLLEFEDKRNRPFLLAARVPETVEGAHFDGLDVETWAHEQMVDLFALGVRSFEVDIQGYRVFTRHRNIKLYPSLDDWHSSDGYQWPPIEIFRGIFANWWRQGADGIHTFNFSYGRPEKAARIGVPFPDPVVNVWRSAQWSQTPVWETHLQAYREMGSAQKLRTKNKTFVIQRRGGGGHPSLEPEKWHTPPIFLCQFQYAVPTSSRVGQRRHGRYAASTRGGGQPGSGARPDQRSQPADFAVRSRCPAAAGSTKAGANLHQEVHAGQNPGAQGTAESPIPGIDLWHPESGRARHSLPTATTTCLRERGSTGRSR